MNNLEIRGKHAEVMKNTTKNENTEIKNNRCQNQNTGINVNNEEYVRCKTTRGGMER